MAEATITVGVDFAASPTNTAACEIHWYARHAVVERADANVDDAAFLRLLEVLPEDGRLGLDCPLGWPVAFVSAVRAHHEHAPWPTRGSSDRTELVWRATDRWVRQRCGRWPLSVSTDRIGVTALRAAYLFDAWDAMGGTVDRSGVTGPVVEVYPAVARRVWGMEAVRSVDEIEARLPIRFSNSAARHASQASEHVFDALVGALVAPAAALGRTDAPPADLRDVAAAEGWIHVPSCAIDELVEPRSETVAGPAGQDAKHPAGQDAPATGPRRRASDRVGRGAGKNAPPVLQETDDEVPHREHAHEVTVLVDDDEMTEALLPHDAGGLHQLERRLDRR